MCGGADLRSYGLGGFGHDHEDWRGRVLVPGSCSVRMFAVARASNNSPD